MRPDLKRFERGVTVALIKNFTRKDRDRVSLHEEIQATYTSFERDGRVVLQIDTYGRDTRQVPGKQSQTIQLDHDGAEALCGILKREFHF
ncbi:methionyl-tRNA formyltransferase [Methyloferula stellata]|uniref:methionyl-tRNA formyltransferase n=1 Tax=Methyloferula stellata TaxID=876270 RepID=UPI001FCB0C9A|nr:methionyl-tRNA formyltransferase [Methyloferula stellata]